MITVQFDKIRGALIKYQYSMEKGISGPEYWNTAKKAYGISFDTLPGNITFEDDAKYVLFVLTYGEPR